MTEYNKVLIELISWKKLLIIWVPFFSFVKNIERTPPSKNYKFMYVPKNKGTTSSNGREDLNMICVYPDFIRLMKVPIYENKFLNFVPTSMIIKNIHAKPPRKCGCVIEELETKDDNT